MKYKIIEIWFWYIGSIFIYKCIFIYIYFILCGFEFWFFFSFLLSEVNMSSVGDEVLFYGYNYSVGNFLK